MRLEKRRIEVLWILSFLIIFVFSFGQFSEALTSVWGKIISTASFAFAKGVNLTKVADGSVGPWSTNRNSLPSARSNFASVEANGYVYVIGGYSNGFGINTVFYAKLNSDGTTGAWVTNANALPDERYAPASVVANGYIYVIGGYDNYTGSPETSVNTVYYAKLNTDGSTGMWQTSVNILPVGVYSHSSIVANGYVYVIGGTGGPAQSAVYYSKLNSDGSIGAWLTSVSALPVGTTGHSSVASNGYVYVIGGSDGVDVQAAVYYAKLNSDGSVDAWQTSPNALPAGRYLSSVVSTDGYVYVTGGYDTNNQSTVYFANLNSDGSTGTWTTNINALPEARSSHSSIASNGYIYVLGGVDESNIAQSSVFYAKINSGSIPSPATSVWSMSANDLPATRWSHSSVANNGYVYVLGGIDGGSTQLTVYYAKLGKNGSVGEWMTSANALPAERRYLSSAVSGDYIYVLGGADATSALSSVFYAKLNRRDGSVGAWMTNANPLPANRSSSSSFVADGYVYVVGGFDSQARPTVYYAKINRDGSAGAWQENVNVLPAGRLFHTAVSDGKYAYVIGGKNALNGTSQDTVYYAKINRDASIGAWTTSANVLPEGIAFHSSVIADGYVFVLGGMNISSSIRDTVYYAKINRDGSVGAWRTSIYAMPEGRFFHTSVENNGSLYVIGGADESNASQSSIFYVSASCLLSDAQNLSKNCH